GDQAVPGDKDNAVEFLEFGLSVRFKVTGLNDGRVRLQTVLERTEREPGEHKDIQLRGQIVRSIARLKLGESVKLVERDDRGEARHWLRIKIVKEESVISRTRSAEASKETPQEKVGEVRLVDKVYPVADLIGKDATALIQV